MNQTNTHAARLLERGLVENGSARKFDEKTLPEALLKEHALSAGNWAILQLTEGSVTFIDLETNEEIEIIAPDSRIIEPQKPHKLKMNGALKVQLAFYKQAEPAAN